MSRRFTRTEKWDDPWFFELSPVTKLFFVYICDKCDNAGFWDINMRLAALSIGVGDEDVEKALGELREKYIKGGSVLYLRNFLKHQRNLPLRASKPHNAIRAIFQERGEFGREMYRNLPTDRENEENQRVSIPSMDGIHTVLSRNSKGIVKDKYSKEEGVGETVDVSVPPKDPLVGEIPSYRDAAQAKDVICRLWNTYKDKTVCGYSDYPWHKFYRKAAGAMANGYTVDELEKVLTEWRGNNGSATAPVWQIWQSELASAKKGPSRDMYADDYGVERYIDTNEKTEEYLKFEKENL